jgi:predicted NUDIX family phosphoesterase
MSPDKAAEEVLVVTEEQFHRAGLFHGFRPFSEDYFRILLDPAHLSFRPRGQVESDPSFKQLIPYVILRSGDQVFYYRRGSAGTEKRLQAKRSIGLGGHISREDGTSDFYRAGLEREIREEVEISSPYTESVLGFIYDDRTPVGSVHLGIVHVLELKEPLAYARETAIAEARFDSLAAMRDDWEAFETWSQFALEELVKG